MGEMYIWLLVLGAVLILAVVVTVLLLTRGTQRTHSDPLPPQPSPASSPAMATNAPATVPAEENDKVSKTDELTKALEAVRPTLNDDDRRVLGEIVKSGGEVLQSDLPEKSDFSKATVSKVIKSLETMGIVIREKHKWTYWVRISDKLISRTKNA